MKKKINSRRKVLILAILLIISIFGGYLAWANYSTSFYYFPASYVDNSDVHLSITASGPNNSLDYYPGGYGVFINKDANGLRKLTKFEIYNPSIASNESYSSDTLCDSNGQPAFCVSMNYVFRWTDPSGRQIESIVPSYKYNGQTGFVDIINDILANAVVNGDTSIAKPTSLVVKQGLEELLIVKTYFGDDRDLNGVSFYTDISKKFAFRTNKSETGYIGIAHSQENLWGANGKVAPADMWKLNFATVHVKANTPGILNYRSWIGPNQTSVKVITVDMDNIAYDSASRPELVPYIDVKLKRKNPDGTFSYVDKNGNASIEPIHRISLQPTEYTKNWKTIPGINPATTEHSIGPSGSFRCNLGTIGTPGFVTCANDVANFKGITQHTITVPQYNDYQVLEFTIRNASTYAGNAFAIAGNIDMFGDDVPLDTLLNVLGQDSGIVGTTTVEVDAGGMGDGENGFDDDTKETKINYLHTYKTEICNRTQSPVNNTLIKLNLPVKGSLVGTNDTDSSLFLSGSNLDNPIDETKRLPLSSFGGNINVGNLAVGECKFITYQATVDNTVIQGDILKVKNEFSYNGGATEFTNEVINPVLAMPYDASILLKAEPISGSNVLNLDYITYDFTIENTGLTDIGTGSVVCGRFADTTETECKVGNECGSQYNFTNFKVGDEINVVYAVQVKDGVPVGTRIEEQCQLKYEDGAGTINTKDSNIVFHNVVDQSTIVDGGTFSLQLYSRPKLLNTPDGNPRPDGLDQSPIKYTYKYTGSNHEYMYPQLSLNGTYTDSRGGCSSITWPNRPNAITYNIDSTSLAPQYSLNLSSRNINYSLDTTLPNTTPKTTLYGGSLTPTHYVPGNEANSWYKNGGEKTLPLTATKHRALVNGTDGRISSDITGTTSLDKWQFIPWSTGTCSYVTCGRHSCTTHYIPYIKYRWEMITKVPVQFDASAFRFVTVGGSSAWLKTSNGNVHTNDKLTEEGTVANDYNLGEAGYTNVKSAPKLYAPTGASHGDYIVSSNTSTTNLKSKKNWYIYNKNVKRGHGYIYDRTNNPRDFYTDLLEKQKFGEVIEKTDTSLSRIDMELNKVYYYPGDLTLERAGGDIIVAGEKATLVVGGNLYINSNIKYSIEEKDSIKKLPFLGLIVKGNVYIDGNVTDTVGAWYVDGTLHTGDSVKALRHLGNWIGDSFDFQRKAPEFYERDVNEPSEWIYFDDRIYVTTPPGFSNLDDGIWSYKSNINQYSGEEVEY